MYLDWYKCSGDVWCELNRVDLNHKYIQNTAGVYVIWEGKDNSVIKVGHGKIGDELQNEVKDKAILAFSNLILFVSWAEVSMINRKGVYTYLSNALHPKISESDLKGSGIEVNFPWEEE